MNIIDVVIIFFLLLGGSYGVKNGFFKQTVMLIGTVLCFVLSWYFKDFIANFLSYNLPFFNFAGSFEGLTSLNIVFYQLISFVILMILFTSVLTVLIKVTNAFEKFLNFTIILGIPSKILGFVVGVLESYVILFVVLFFLYQPIFNIDIINESKITPKLLNSSIVLSNVTGNMNDAVNDIYDLTKSYNNTKNADKFNRDVIDILLDRNVIDMEYVQQLEEKGKINY